MGKRYNGLVNDVEARALPAVLNGLASEEISAACSCLHITPISTYTDTITAPTPVSQT